MKRFCRCFLYGVWARERQVIFMKRKENFNLYDDKVSLTTAVNKICDQRRRMTNLKENPNIPKMMTIRQAAATGILPEAALRRMVKDGTIPAVFSGNKAFINFDRLCEMLSQLGAVS